MALRATLGASHGRLVQQLATESLLLAGLGGVAGLLAAAWGLDLLLAWSPDHLPRLSEVHLDGRVLAFTGGITLLAGLLCGLAPIRSSLTFSLSERLKGEGMSAGTADRRARGLFVAAEFALALPLLVAAGLMIRSFFELSHVDPGFNPANTVTAHFSLPETRYPDPGSMSVFCDELRRRVWSFSGVRSLGLGSSLPPNNLWERRTFAVEGRPLASDQSQPVAGWVSVSPGYFETLEVPLREGRFPLERDREDTRPIAVVDETLARRYFGRGTAVGRQIRAANCGDCPWRTIVGVVGRVKMNGLGSPDEPTVYVPQGQESRRAMYLAVRTRMDPRAFLPVLRETLEDPSAPWCSGRASPTSDSGWRRGRSPPWC